jgi:hypothetical protein
MGILNQTAHTALAGGLFADDAVASRFRLGLERRQRDSSAKIITTIIKETRMRSTKLLVALAMCVGLVEVNAAQSVTYDFTGVVDSVANTSISTGSVVTGTFTIDYENANPAQAGGNIPFGSSTLLAGYNANDWNVVNKSGQSLGIAPNATYVFSSTAQVGTLSYATNFDPPSNSYYLQSNILGGVENAQEYGYSSVFSATEESEPVNGTAGFKYSDFYILSHNTNEVAFTSAGLPVFDSANMVGVGEVVIGSQAVQYQLTSLALASTISAPEIDANQASAAIMLLLGSLTVLRARKQ